MGERIGYAVEYEPNKYVKEHGVICVWPRKQDAERQAKYHRNQWPDTCADARAVPVTVGTP